METTISRDTVYKMRTFLQGLTWGSVPTLADYLASENPEDWTDALYYLSGLRDGIEEILNIPDARKILEA